MRKGEFSKIRRQLGKTQNQMAQLLGTSVKAVQSFEQGWRKIPAHVERQTLFLLVHQLPRNKIRGKCWVVLQCPSETKRDCPAWEFKVGHLCWFINGTICHGEVQPTWQKKMRICRKCDVFHSMFPVLYD